MPERQPAPWRRQERFAPILDEAPMMGKSAMMRLYGAIDSDGAPWGISAAEVGVALDSLDESTDRIEVHIHSRGGDAFEGLAIMNQLRQHPATVDVIVDGLAASAASYIAIGGGDTVTMAPNSQMMIHDAAGLCVGQAADMQMMLDRLNATSENIASVYASKTGGTVEEWRAAMQPESWYSPQEAVDAGLVDRVLPADDTNTPAPTASFDLSIFAHAGRDHAPAPFIPAASAAHKSPAEPPEKHPHPKEADAMSDTELKALRERLGLAENADLSAINAKLDELEEQATAPTSPEVTEEQALAVLAKTHNVKAEVVKAALGGEPTAPEGKVIVSETLLDELKANAKLGAEARAKQLEAERDEAIEAAFTSGKISAERRDTWRNAWDKDPEGTKADLDSLEARFPVGQAKGYAGSDETDGDGTKPFTDNEAEALASLTGTKKEALLHE